MSDEAGGRGTDNDPMGVRRRWGRRELVLLVVAAILIAAVAVLARQGRIGRPASGPPAGQIPGAQPVAGEGR